MKNNYHCVASTCATMSAWYVETATATAMRKPGYHKTQREMSYSCHYHCHLNTKAYCENHYYYCDCHYY